MLEDPRELLARALLPLLPAPPKAPPPLRDALLLETLRLPMRSEPPPRLAALGCCRVEASERFPALSCCPPWFCRALACRLAVDAPPVVPPNLLAVA